MESNIRIETVCDDYLRAWFMKFGSPGSKNDAQKFYQSFLFNKIRSGPWSLVSPRKRLRGFVLTWLTMCHAEFCILGEGINLNAFDLNDQPCSNNQREAILQAERRSQEYHRAAVRKLVQ